MRVSNPLFAFAGLVLGACAGLPRAAPVPPPASRAMQDADLALREGGPGARARAHELAIEAALLAPDWVAPERLLDQLAVDALDGVDVLAVRRRELALQPDSAALNYLVGRLEGLDGLERHERALALDPGLSWAHHALAWNARARGDLRGAAAQEASALELARDPWETVYFSGALAGDLAAGGRAEAALRVLERARETPGLSAGAATAVEAGRLRLALVHPDRARRMQARTEALALLRDADLSAADVSALAGAWRATAQSEGGDAGELVELEAALAARPGAERDLLRAELLVLTRPSPLALGLFERGLARRERLEADLDPELEREPDEGPGSAHAAAAQAETTILRAARFAAGEPGGAVERWLAALPAGLRDDEGLPRDARLARVVRAARALPSRAGAQGAEEDARIATEIELGEALLAAGWFREARALSESLAGKDLEGALALEERAVAVLAALRAIDRALVPDTARARDERGEELERRRELESFDGRLAALAEPLAAALRAQGDPVDVELLRAELVASPRLAYGPLGQLVQPGPVYGVRDEELGFGDAGAPVPGLARAMDRLGRFALYGELAASGGPDATVLRRVAVEERSGRHLGRPWSGVAVFVEGADLEGRASREGARIAGAALHEGYWVDIEAVRDELAGLESLRREFQAGGREAASERIARALTTRGLAVDMREGVPTKRGRRERVAVLHPLGESRRIRLALLAERAEPGSELLGRATLDELVELTALHEEGHLVDRSRFLPFGRDVGGMLAILIRSGPSPRRINEELEERAQLVALCEAPEPRFALAQLVDALEGGSGVHATGYRRVAEELVRELERALEEDPSAYPMIDPTRTLVHQLHRLGAEDVRALGLSLARRRGLVAD